MKNPLPIHIEQNQTGQNLSIDAKELLQILDELQDFTTKIRKRLMSELKSESSTKNSD